MCGHVGWLYTWCWWEHILLRILMSQRISGRLYKYIASPCYYFLYIWLEVHCLMQNMFLLVWCREFSVSSTPFQTAFKYLRSVATWSQEFLLLILQRLVVSFFTKLFFLFLQIYRSFIFYIIAWEMWLYIFPYTVTWVPVTSRIFTINVQFWPGSLAVSYMY